jgi:hypothetical protein
MLAAVMARFAAEWTETPVRWPNGGAFVPGDPDAVDYAPSADTGAPWLYAEILGAGSSGTVIGSPGKRSARDDAVLFVHVFTPVGTGDAEALRLARAAAELFRLARFGGLVAGIPDPLGSGERADADGVWWRRSVSIPLTAHYTV